MAFVGNINQSVDALLKTSHLFDPSRGDGLRYGLPGPCHCYVPGGNPKYRPESFTGNYGFITDYLAEFMRR